MLVRTFDQFIRHPLTSFFKGHGAIRSRAIQIIGPAIILAILVGMLAVPSQAPTRAAAGWQWYKVDTHVHSTVSADAFSDIGIHSQAAIENSYDAIFLTDHNGGSSFQINNMTANHMVFDDALTRWEIGTYGTPDTSVNALETNPVNTGTSSLHLKSSSTTSGETYIWTKRGPNFRSGDILLNVSIYPTRIDPGSGVYVSASIGGDPTVLKTPNGYTTVDGVVSPGKSTVLVWQLGSGRAASSDPNARVLTYSLGSYTLNAWNHYTIDISNALADIPLADRPLDYDALTYLKIAATADNGTAEAYFDTYSIDASAPVDPAFEYIYRTGVVDDFNTPTFKVFPSYEMGQQKHTNRFNFGITVPSEYRTYTYGSDGILDTQLSGYPTQLNHPGTTITVQDAIDTQGQGADFLEVREQDWIDAWDAILQQGVPIIGAWSTDSHSGITAGKGATYLYAPSFDFDELIHSYYEGRSYVAQNNFTGRFLFNLDSTSQEPYPARYPVYVSDTLASANVHLAVTSGLGTGYKINWFRNGVSLASDTRTATSYDVTKPVSLTGAFTYVRAEVRSSATSIKGMTEPIFFVDVPGLPTDKTFHIDRITNANGKGYNKLLSKGITASSWNSTLKTLSLSLENPAGALVKILGTSASSPKQVAVNGVTVAQSSSLAAFESATTSAWYYDAGTQQMYLKILHAATAADAVLTFSSGPLPTPTYTSTPTNTPTASPIPTSFSFAPVADSFVRDTAPTTNYGTSTALRVDASPIDRSYLRFNVTGLTGPVGRATLRLLTSGNSAAGYEVHAVSDNTWGEMTINYNNAPSVDTLLGSTGAITGGTWVIVDVTPYITGNGNFSLVLTTPSTTAISLSSRETGANAPQLVIETQNGPTFTPTTTPTSTNTPTNTPTPTATNLGAPTATATSTPTNTPTPTASSASNAFTFNPVGDSYVNESSPTSNYGATTSLRTDASPIVSSYLRFNVQGLSGTITKATLRIYATSGNGTGYNVNSVADNTWSELTLNYTNAPPVGNVAGSSGPVTAGTWTSVDITALVTGNGSLNLAVTSTSSTATSYSSREAGANAPQLIIETVP